ncbi:unnamed protein product [Acanthoscelides obtectus]|uniref:Uncharacterized protein n=1 Tax=Acanthoscelides obtectus TaxID=200917 RepID=A0A9P0K525_ACAOB|nr:unnamed protein product [Acanthoscelides obtectus]CAK1648735.1 hypothetical protein AOBTE_LOCUS15846 [Acanthoscelides obtectus]
MKHGCQTVNSDSATCLSSKAPSVIIDNVVQFSVILIITLITSVNLIEFRNVAIKLTYTYMEIIVIYTSIREKSILG